MDDSAAEGTPEPGLVNDQGPLDPAAVENLVCIAGLVSGSSREGVFRIYTSPDLSEFFEVHEDQVRKYRVLDTAESPLGGSLLWVDADAQLLRVTAEMIRAEAAAQSPRPAEF